MSEQRNKDRRPPPPSWIDKGFIQTALRTGENDSRITVVSCDFSMATAEGDGYLSNLYRANVMLQGGEERRLIIKCEPEGGKQEEFVKSISAFTKETKMFCETLPAIQKLLEKIGVHRRISAKCLFHGTKPVPFIILEDLRWAGYNMADRKQGLDLDHCKLVVKTHALFHAASLVLYEQDPNALVGYEQSMYNDAFGENYIPFLDNALKAVRDTVLTWPGYERYSTKIENIRNNVYGRLKDDSKYKAGKFNTLLHGDVWTNNYMFKYNNGTVEDVRLVDFQCCYYSSPTIDLQNFLSTSSKENVRDHIDYLLKEYHTTLTDTLEKLQCRTSITFEELKRDFDYHSIFGFCSTCSGLPFILSDLPKKMDAMELLQSSDCTLRCIEDVAESGVFERIMKKLLIKYEALGVI